MFDVEGARKAGYTDAEIAGFMARSSGFDAAAAKKSGYSDSEIISHLAAKPMRTGAAAVPTAQEVATGVYTPPPQQAEQPAPSIMDRAVGNREAALTLATGATGGTLGMLGGTLKGIAEQILAGNFGTPEAAKLVEQSAVSGAQALTYAPRTEQGKEQAQALGEMLQQTIPLAGLAPQMAAMTAAVPRGAPAGVVARTGIEAGARAVGGEAAAAGAVRTMNAATRAADMAGKQITTIPRRALEALRNEPAATPGTMGSVGAAGVDMATQRQALASNLPVPIKLTKGQASRDPAQLKFEVETAKLPGAGGPLRERLVQQNEQILQNFDAWIDQTGAEAPNLRATGVSVDNAVVRQAARDKAEVNVAYSAAKRSPEASALVDQSMAVSLGDGDGAISGTPLGFLNSQPTGLPNTALADAARQYAVRLGVAEMRDGQLVPRPATIRQLEDWRRAIGQATDYEPSNVRTSTILKGMIDAQTEPVAGPMFRQARALRRRYAQNYEDRAVIAKMLKTKRGTSDRQVAFEDVFDHTVLKGSLDDVRNVRRVLQRSGPEGQQAWRELQGQTAKWIKGEAERNSATDSMGNRVVSTPALDKAIQTLDADGRLDFIFGKQGAQRMRDIRDLAQIARTVPPEAAANTSNTASTLLAGFVDVGSSSMSGVPLPIATMARVVRQHVKDAALRRRIEEALGDIGRR